MVEVYDRFGNQRDMEWLREKYGDVQLLHAGPRPKFVLARIQETVGPAAITVRVQDINGNGIVSQPVANHWPDPSLPSLVGGNIKTLWHDRGLVQYTNQDGFTGYGLGGGSFYWPPNGESGPHTLWPLSPTYPSDGISGVGMLAGTNHSGPLHLTWVLDEREDPDEPEPPADDGELLAEVRAIRKALEALARHLGAME